MQTATTTTVQNFLAEALSGSLHMNVNHAGEVRGGVDVPKEFQKWLVDEFPTFVGMIAEQHPTIPLHVERGGIVQFIASPNGDDEVVFIILSIYGLGLIRRPAYGARTGDFHFLEYYKYSEAEGFFIANYC